MKAKVVSILFLAVLAIFLMIVLTVTAPVQGAEFGISYGINVWNPSWCSPGVKTHALELEVKMPVKKWVNLNWLDIGIVANKIWSDTSPGHIIDDVYFNGQNTSLILALRLTARKMISDTMFLEGYGSLGWMNPKEHPELGDSGMLGNWGGNIGYDFGNWSLLYGAGHWSDPLRGRDKGHNLQYLKIRIPFGKKGKK